MGHGMNGFLALNMHFLAIYSQSYMALNDLGNAQVSSQRIVPADKIFIIFPISSLLVNEIAFIWKSDF